MKCIMGNIYGMLFYFPSSLFLFLHDLFNTFQPSLYPHTMVVGPTSEGKQRSEDNDDEPSQLSLADRVRLFNQKIQDDARAPVVLKEPAPTRKRLAQVARFKTQPVTTEEVETAARRISPLAASFAKAPDPKVLGAIKLFTLHHVMYTLE
jgi:hypothetical protein